MRHWIIPLRKPAKNSPRNFPLFLVDENGPRRMMWDEIIL
jgi:hypothetical protein